MDPEIRFSTPRRKKSGGNMSAVNAFLMECAASPDSPFPNTTLSSTARLAGKLNPGIRSSDTALDKEEIMHTPITSRKGGLLDQARSRGPTPPSQGSTYSATSHLSYGSSSSSKMLTDSSTAASGGSSTRTPDTDASGMGYTAGRKLYGAGLGKGSSSRTFGRTASAPVGPSTTHLKDYENKMLMKEDNVQIVAHSSPTLESSRQDETGNVSNTVTLPVHASRPALLHTSSNSSIPSEKGEAYKTPVITSRYQTARSTDRTKLLNRSTLLTFGGPVKRSKATQLVTEGGVGDEHDGAVNTVSDLVEEMQLKKQVDRSSSDRYATVKEEGPMESSRSSPILTQSAVSTGPSADNIAQLHHRMSPPKRFMENIPATIPEDAETPPKQAERLDVHGSGERQAHSRSASVSPAPSGVPKVHDYARHRHSPSVPTAYATERDKENKAPYSYESAPRQLTYYEKKESPSRVVQVDAQPQHHYTEEARRSSRSPEAEARRRERDILSYDIAASRASNIQGTIHDQPIASSSIPPRPATSQSYHFTEHSTQPIEHGDPYGVSYATAPVYQTPGSQAPLRQPTDYANFESARSAPPVPPQGYYTEIATATPAPAALPAGRKCLIFNNKEYERISLLGKGGSSKVYSVLDPSNRKIYALKRVQLDRSDPDTIDNYLNEIELLRRLSGHDRIIQLIDHSISYTPSRRPKILQMMMELGEIDFAALFEAQREKPLNMNFVALYWQQMLEAVQAVHDQNVVHTDLKPANFVLVKGKLKIIDFGIAKAIANDTVNIHRDTQVGTVNYMSPEAILKMSNTKVHKLSFSSDVWSLGCILYQMIYGSPPFQGIGGGPLMKMQIIGSGTFQIPYPSSVTAARKHSEEPASPGTPPVSVPIDAIDSIRRCLQHDRNERMTIPELLDHAFLKPSSTKQPRFQLPDDHCVISSAHMEQLVAYCYSAAGKNQLQTIGVEGLSKFLFKDLKGIASLDRLARQLGS